MPQKFISEAVLKNIYLLPDYNSLKVLDLSCGEGYIISQLAKEGLEVTGTHFKEGDYIIENREHLSSLNIVTGVDLHKKLPFEDESFDLILMTEVLEHLETHFNIIREVSRVIAKGGYFIFTTPNQYRLHSRLQFFASGHHKLIQRRLSWDLSSSDLYANHINLVNFPLINTLLYQGNMRIEKMFFTRFKWKHFYMIPFYTLFYFFSLFRRKRNTSNKRHEGALNISSWMNSLPMAFSEQMALIIKKGTVIESKSKTKYKPLFNTAPKIKGTH